MVPVTHAEPLMHRLVAALMLQRLETEIAETGIVDNEIGARFLVPKVDHRVIKEHLISGAAIDDLEVNSRKGKDHPTIAVNRRAHHPLVMIEIAENRSLNCLRRRFSSTQSVRMICRTPQKLATLRAILPWYVQEIGGDALVDRRKVGRIQLREFRWMFSLPTHRARQKRLMVPNQLRSPGNATVVAGVAEAVRRGRMISRHNLFGFQRMPFRVR